MVACDHKFVICDAQAEDKFLCKECDERFANHPLIKPGGIKAPSNLYMNINVGDTVRILDSGIWRTSTVTIHSMRAGGIQVKYPYRTYLFTIPFEKLIYNINGHCKYKSFHMDQCTPHQCAFEDPDCSARIPNV